MAVELEFATEHGQAKGWVNKGMSVVLNGNFIGSGSVGLNT